VYHAWCMCARERVCVMLDVCFVCVCVCVGCVCLMCVCVWWRSWWGMSYLLCVCECDGGGVPCLVCACVILDVLCLCNGGSEISVWWPLVQKWGKTSHFSRWL